MKEAIQAPGGEDSGAQARNLLGKLLGGFAGEGDGRRLKRASDIVPRRDKTHNRSLQGWVRRAPLIKIPHVKPHGFRAPVASPALAQAGWPEKRLARAALRRQRREIERVRRMEKRPRARA